MASSFTAAVLRVVDSQSATMRVAHPEGVDDS